MALGIKDLISNHNLPNDDEKIKITYIDIDKIEPNKYNFYATEAIEDLAFNIACVGLAMPLTVRKLENGKYELIGGHRRRLAIKLILEKYDDELKEKYRKVPCIEKKENSGDTEIDELKYQLLLIMENSSNRVKTDYEKMQELKKTKNIFTELKAKNKNAFKGRVRDEVAKIINISTSTAAKLESIDNNLSEELKEEFKQNKINTAQAYALSQKPKDEQEEKLAEYKESGKMPKAEDIRNKKIKEEAEEQNEEKSEEKQAVEEVKNSNENVSEYASNNEIRTNGECNISAEREPKIENEEDMHRNIEKQFRKFFDNFPCCCYFGNYVSDNSSYNLGFDFNFKIIINNISFFNGMVTLKSNSASTFICFKETDILKCGIARNELEKDSYFLVKTKGDNGIKSILEFRKAVK